MFDQNQFAIAFLSIFLMKQQATQKDQEAMLNCLAERMKSAGDQNRHTVDRLMAQGAALEQMAAQVLGLAERVEAGGAKQQRADFVLGAAAVCIGQHSEALEQMCAAVRELTERVEAVEYLQQQMRRAQCADGSLGKPTTSGRKAKKHHQDRKTRSTRQLAGNRA